MSLIRSLESPQHARVRFNGTLVNTKQGIPVIINNIDDEWRCYCNIVGNEKAIIINDIRNGDILTAPVNLGFCQIGNQAVYLTRRPARIGKQGLSLDQINIINTIEEGVDLYSKKAQVSLYHTLTNDYSSLKNAITSLRKTKSSKSLSFHRDWALLRVIEDEGNTTHVLYKFYGKVGLLEADGKIILNEKFSFLKETLLEDVGNVYEE